MEPIILQGSVATHARYGEIINSPVAVNLLENFPVKESRKSVKILKNNGHEFRVQFVVFVYCWFRDAHCAF